MNKLFRLAAYAAVAVGLMGCDVSAQSARNYIVVKDELDGCLYRIPTSAWKYFVISLHVDSSGKPMCGKP